MAKTDLERLVVQLSADVKQYNNALNKAMGNTNRTAKKIETRFQRMNKNIQSSFGNFSKGFLGAIATGVSVDKLRSLLDTSTRITNALKVAGLSGKELTDVYDQLFASAQRNAVPVEDLVTLYSRATMAADNLGASQTQLKQFTDAVAASLRVSGKSTQEASGALLQLSQLLSGNMVQAQEYNSLIDGAYPLLQAVAAGLKEAGGDVGKLTSLVKTGKVPTKAFFDAFLAGASTLDSKVASATYTTSQGFTLVQNALVDAARKFDETTETSKALGDSLQGVAEAIQNFDVDHAVSEFQRYIQSAQSAITAANNFMLAAGQAVGLNKIGEYIASTRIGQALGAHTLTSPESRMAGSAPRVPSYLQDYINKTYGGEKTGALDVTVNPVSLSNYAATGKGAGSKGGKRSREDSFERETRQIKERTANLQAETAAQAGINPLIDDYDYAITKARASQELINAAQKAGIEVTPALKAQIDQLAEGYANATVESNKLEESQRNLRQRAEEMRDLGQDVMGGFINDLISGKSAADALADALGKIGSKLLDIALDSLFHPVGGGPGGLLGGAIIPGILHSGGVAGSDGYGHGRAVSSAAFTGARRMHTGGVAGGLRSDEVPAILQRGEIVLPKGTKSTSGGAPVVNFAPTIDARGAQQGVGAEITAALDKYSRHTLPQLIKQVNADPRKRG